MTVMGRIRKEARRDFQDKSEGVNHRAELMASGSTPNGSKTYLVALHAYLCIPDSSSNLQYIYNLKPMMIASDNSLAISLFLEYVA